MSKRDKFYIPQIEEEKKKEEHKPSKFISPYEGSQAKDEHVYPYVQYGNDGKQYHDLKSKQKDNSGDLDVIYTNRKDIEEEKKRKEEDKYSPNRIPSYYRKEENLGINRYNLPDLRGDRLTDEEIIEKNRRQYGNNYQEAMKNLEKNNQNNPYPNDNSINNTNNQNNKEIIDPLRYSQENDFEDFSSNDNNVNNQNNANRNYEQNPRTNYNQNVNDNNQNRNNYNYNNNNINSVNNVNTPNNRENVNNASNTNNMNNVNTNIDFFHIDDANSNNNQQNTNNQRNASNQRNRNDFNQNQVFDDFGNINKPVDEIVNPTPRRESQARSNDNSQSKGLMFGNKKAKYIIPPLEILKRNGRMSGVNGNEVNYQISVINRTLEEFKVGGKVINYTKGPTVTQFEVKLDPGVNVNKVTGLQKNLQMNLESESIRIQAPIPGKSTVGIEAPNMVKDVVLFGDMVSNEKFLKDGKPLNVILGLSISGDPIYANIGDMPHCLVAGATGGGKTVCLYSMITSMLYKVSPEEVKMILIDPKRNELIYFEDIPHLATPIIDDPKLATASLKWAVEEMERRYDFLKANRKRTIGDYNDYALANGLKIIPYIVIVIDEFADLMNTASETFETNVQRLTQKARSAGIHLIIATQRPSTDVIKGTIKANIPTRIAFSVQTTVDSLTILDHVGAEKLLGKGDMLYTKGNNDIRIQGSYISETELDAISSFYYEQNITQNFMFTHDEIRAKSESDGGDGGSSNDPMDDELFDEVARFVFRQRKASANQIQNIYGIGFNRANKIIGGLAQIGVVTSDNIPGKAREVIIKEIDELEDILRNR